MTPRLPVVFISHGSPMHAILPSEAAKVWATIPSMLPSQPRAILMVSAHWDTGVPLLGGAAQPETIHDFGGFAEELYRIRYPAAGAPDVAREAQALLRDAGITAGIDGCRGLDHGAWVPLLKMYPQSDVPVLQLSVQPELGAAHHLAVGRALVSLRDQGVLVVGSGHMTHNLRDWLRSPGQGSMTEYAHAFRDWVDLRIRERRIDELLQWETEAPYAQHAHPTPEHFLPLFIALGAAGMGYRASLLHSGYDKGVLAMDAYLLS